MRLSALSFIERSPIVTLAMIAMACMVICVLASFTEEKPRKHRIGTGVIFWIAMIYTARILELNSAVYYEDLSGLSSISEKISSIPVGGHYLFLVSIIGYSIYGVYKTYRYTYQNFTPRTICEVIENLPMGIAFYDGNGFLYLSNRIIHSICRDITTKDLQNGLELEHDLKRLEQTSKCVIKGDELSFILSDGSVWRFSRSEVIIQGRVFTKIQADNVTEIYHLADDIRIANVRLKKEQVRLQNYMKNMSKYISEKETLRVKMRVHDDFGEMIALTVQSFEGQSNAVQKAEILERWGKLGENMKRLLTSDSEQYYTLEKTMDFANQLGSVIEIVGELPKEEAYRNLVIHAIHETVKNAVYHAHAYKVFVTIIDTEEKHVIAISNKVRKNMTTITLGGGLGALKQRTEDMGGSFEVICKEGITLKMTLLKEGYNVQCTHSR